MRTKRLISIISVITILVVTGIAAFNFIIKADDNKSLNLLDDGGYSEDYITAGSTESLLITSYVYNAQVERIDYDYSTAASTVSEGNWSVDFFEDVCSQLPSVANLTFSIPSETFIPNPSVYNVISDDGITTYFTAKCSVLYTEETSQVTPYIYMPNIMINDSNILVDTPKYLTNAHPDGYPVKNIYFAESVANVMVGETYTVKYETIPFYASFSDIVFSCDSYNVDIRGNEIIPYAAGTYTITGTNEYSGTSASFQMIVSAPNITLSSSNITMEVGEKEVIDVTLTPYNNAITPSFISDDENVATVSANGEIIARGAGSTIIRVNVAGIEEIVFVTVSEPAPQVDEIFISASNTTIYQGETVKLLANVKATNIDPVLAWTLDDFDVATISASGVVTGLNPGVVHVSCSAYNTTSNTITITVKEKEEVKNISIRDTDTPYGEFKISGSYEVNGSYQLVADILPKTLANKSVSWSVEDTSIATISKTGLLTPKKSGTTTVSASCDNVTANYTIYVTEPIKYFEVTSPKNGKVELEKGSEYQIQYKSENIATKDISFTTDKPSVISLSSTGKITALQTGTAIIQIKAGEDIYSKLTVTVTETIPVKTIDIGYDSIKVKVNDSFTFTPVFYPSNATNTASITWRSSNTAVAEVSSNGKITAKKKGSATIFASIRNSATEVISDTCIVSVTEDIVPTKLNLFVNNTEMTIGDTQKIETSVEPSNATTSITFSSSNASVASVSSNGTITAKAVGTAVITAKTSNNITSTITITVTKKEVVVVETPTNIYLSVGETAKLITNYSPSDIVFSYKVDNKNIVSFTGTKITGLKAGTTNITISNSKDKTTKKVTVQVSEKANTNTSIRLTSKYYEKEVGDKFSVSIVVTPSSNKNILTWSSSNSSVATVSNEGVVECLAEGSAKITCKVPGGSSVTATVYVSKKTTPDVEGKIILDSSTPSIISLKAGESYTVKYTVNPSSVTASVYSKNQQIATVNGNTVYATAAGETVIVIQPKNGKSKNIILKVSPSKNEESIAQAQYAKDILYYVNIERAKEGLSPLTLDEELSGLAQIRANECEEKYSHTRPNDTPWYTVFDSYSKPSTVKGENLITGSGYTPEEYVQAWMNSPSHRKNIMNPKFTKLGVGSVLYYTTADTTFWGIYVTQLFSN